MKQENYHHNRLLFRPIIFYITFGMLPHKTSIIILFSEYGGIPPILM